MDKTYKAKLFGRQLTELYFRVCRAHPFDRHMDRQLGAAYQELGTILKVERPLEGGFRLQQPNGAAQEYEFSHDAVGGIKAAVTQSLAGSREVPPDSYEDREYLLGTLEQFSKKLRQLVESVVRPEKEDTPVEEDFSDEAPPAPSGPIDKDED